MNNVAGNFCQPEDDDTEQCFEKRGRRGDAVIRVLADCKEERDNNMNQDPIFCS